MFEGEMEEFARRILEVPSMVNELGCKYHELFHNSVGAEAPSPVIVSLSAQEKEKYVPPEGAPVCFENQFDASFFKTILDGYEWNADFYTFSNLN